MVTRKLHIYVIAMLLTLGAQLPGCFFAITEAMASELSEALAHAQLFEGLNPDELLLLEDTAILRHAPAGERIIEQGKSLGRMFIILDGEADVSVNGKKVVSLSGQSLVGEIEFLDGQPASADVVLVSKARLLEINNEALNDLMERQPRLGYVIIRRIATIESQRLRGSNN